MCRFSRVEKGDVFSSDNATVVEDKYFKKTLILSTVQYVERNNLIFFILVNPTIENRIWMSCYFY